MQKTLLLILTMIVSALASQAQVEKNDWLLGGSFNFNTANSSYPSSSTGSSNSNLSPEMGFAVGKNSVVGIRGGISIGSTKDGSGSKQTTSSYQASAFWKKLFPISEKVGWYSDVAAGYNYIRYKNDNTQMVVTSSSRGFSASATPGVYYKAGKKTLLNASIGGLSYYHAKNTDGYTSSSFNLSLLNYFSFGISFILNKEHQM